MNHDESTDLKSSQALGIALIALLTSTLSALSVLFILRLRRGRRPAEDDIQVERVPVQPAVSTAAPAQMPDHFSEDLLVPGLTHTGVEIVEQDDQNGRSPEGV